MVAVQTKGLGSWWADMYSSIAAIRPGTELKLPRRSACRQFPARPALHVGMLVRSVIVSAQNEMRGKPIRDFPVDRGGELEELLVPVTGRHGPITDPVNTSNAANDVVVPFRW